MMSAPRIRHDRAWRGYNDGESVVTSCAACGLTWQALNFTEDAARSAAERHLELVHGIPPAAAAEARQRSLARATR